MTDRPILMSAPMVRAILDGRKTQTRRVVKLDATPMHGWDVLNRYRCPYGQPGDQLWVREAHALDGTRVFYRAGHGEEIGSGPRVDIRWRPSIHMPRWASRILLEITGVRVERLQDISDDDLAAEGIQEVIDAGVDHDGWPRDAYRALWESLNGPGSWDANPWVWVIESQRAQP